MSMVCLSPLSVGPRSRLPVILQNETAECGLACLAMISSHFGHHTNTPDLRRRFGLSMEGATLGDLAWIADRPGMASRAVRIELDELPLLKTPCVLHWDLNHFVVLASAAGGGLVIHDPAIGMRRLRVAEASRHFTGVALEMNPAEGWTPRAQPPTLPLRALLGRMIGLKASLAQLIAVAFALEGCAMVSPLLLEWVVDQGLGAGDRGLLTTLGLGFLFLLLIRAALTAMRGWMFVALSAAMSVQARTNLMSHLLRLPVRYFETRHLGDVMSRFGSQETILQTVTSQFVAAVLDGVMSIIALIIMTLFSPMLTAIVVAGMVLYGGLRWCCYWPLRQVTLEAVVWAARRDSHFLETLRGIRTVKLFNAADERRARWLNLLIEQINKQIVAQKIELLFRTGNLLLVGGLGVLVIWIGAEPVLDQALSIGMLMAFLAYKDQFLVRVSELIDKTCELSMLKLHAERLADIALTAPESRGAPMQPRHRAPVSIRASNLSFHYSADAPAIFENLDFHVAPGESLAIVGASGCGKTTLLKVLAGLIEPTTGSIIVGGEPLSTANLERHRAAIGVVMQDDQLFAGSLADNICFFSDKPDPEKIEHCARMAAIHDDIAVMPMGYETLVGDMGAILSGGQKQRVLLARALYRNPSILLLDEATSHLDLLSERAVNNALNRTGITRIVVAHRPETIRASDRVLTLNGGRADFEPALISFEEVPSTAMAV